MQAFLSQFTYVGIVLALLARGVGVPLPEDLPLLVGGSLCAKGVCRLDYLLPLAFVTVLCSDAISYGLGRRFGHHVTKLPLVRHALTEQRLRKLECAYHADGKKTLFCARFMPAIRTPFFFAAGTVRLPFWTFLAVDTGGALLSVPLLVILGWAFAAHLSELIEFARTARYLLLGVAVLFVTTFFWVRHRRHHRKDVSDTEDGLSE